MDRSTVLYVEDEEDYQLLVRHILGKAGFNVRTASTGGSGLEALEQTTPGVLILDVNLPDTDGYTLCQQVRRMPGGAQVPILMLTVRRRPEEWLKGFSAGADDYVPKPLNPPDLIARVQSCLTAPLVDHKASPVPEHRLVRAAEAGNHAAFEVLVQNYKQRLINSLRGRGHNAADAEDAVSQTFVHAYQRLHQFREKSAFYTWLYRIAVNVSRPRRRRRYNVSLDAITLSEPDRAGEDVTKQLLRAQIRRSVACVPRPYRQMLRWRFVQGWSYERMSRRLHVPPGTVMSRLHRARALLRQAWQHRP